jgi:hypothetical protein
MYHYQHNVMGEQLTGRMAVSADVLDAAVRHFYISTHVGEGFYFENVARYHPKAV